MLRRPLLHRLPVHSVVVFRALHVGDMLCAVPALRALRSALPKAHIALVGLPWAVQFVRRFPAYLDEFLSFPGHPLLPEQTVHHDDLPPFYATVCAREFSLAVQLHGSGDIANHIVSGFGATAMAGHCRGKPLITEKTVLVPYPETGAEPERLLHLVGQLGAPVTDTHLEFPILREDEDELAASGLAAGLEPGSYICVHPGARQRDTCWPPERFARVADQLADEFGMRIVLTGSADEAPLAQAVADRMHVPAIIAAAPLSIGAMAALLSRARLLICNDTGVSHIAAGLGLNSVVIFSKADIARWAPLDRQRHRCIWDPGAERATVVLQHARTLLTGAEPSRQRAAGMWPYW
ncbi:ADP-heptose:LPS heptosyltransferase [Massilia sp. UYP11]|uniref:glycosyltransferase family 9 protein n=1 Tax=Massilia sp. UYP11 TaxID=1756385 RepID=UPI003D1D2B29